MENVDLSEIELEVNNNYTDDKPKYSKLQTGYYIFIVHEVYLRNKKNGGKDIQLKGKISARWQDYPALWAAFDWNLTMHLFMKGKTGTNSRRNQLMKDQTYQQLDNAGINAATFAKLANNKELLSKENTPEICENIYYLPLELPPLVICAIDQFPNYLIERIHDVKHHNTTV